MAHLQPLLVLPPPPPLALLHDGRAAISKTQARHTSTAHRRPKSLLLVFRSYRVATAFLVVGIRALPPLEPSNRKQPSDSVVVIAVVGVTPRTAPSRRAPETDTQIVKAAG